jgi:hypothetical protein
MKDENAKGPKIPLRFQLYMYFRGGPQDFSFQFSGFSIFQPGKGEVNSPNFVCLSLISKARCNKECQVDFCQGNHKINIR